MKIVISISTCLLFSLFTLAQETPDVQLARKIAKRMADTLLLSNQQQNTIFQINKDLFDQKKAVFSSTTNHSNKTSQIQMIENKRDSLYKTVLTVPQYNLYRTKKRFLVNNN